ncbi:hypothetical protein Lal_00031877 [Lupinus albus]|nr:hypothetical protein Lal_00031877 [Lupinus albus]
MSTASMSTDLSMHASFPRIMSADLSILTSFPRIMSASISTGSFTDVTHSLLTKAVVLGQTESSKSITNSTSEEGKI